jgi:hypothetical protein
VAGGEVWTSYKAKYLSLKVKISDFIKQNEQLRLIS